jgi:hypothetical protein
MYKLEKHRMFCINETFIREKKTQKSNMLDYQFNFSQRFSFD